jgi:hypothetical protein
MNNSKHSNGVYHPPHPLLLLPALRSSQSPPAGGSLPAALKPCHSLTPATNTAQHKSKADIFGLHPHLIFYCCCLLCAHFNPLPQRAVCLQSRRLHIARNCALQVVHAARVATYISNQVTQDGQLLVEPCVIGRKGSKTGQLLHRFVQHACTSAIKSPRMDSSCRALQA